MLLQRGELIVEAGGTLTTDVGTTTTFDGDVVIGGLGSLTSFGTVDFMNDVTIGDVPGDTLTIQMKYSDDRDRTISGLRRISTPGLRVYRKASAVPRVLGGLGVAVLSTSHGLMTDREARKRNVGGEVLCYVW